MQVREQLLDAAHGAVSEHGVSELEEVHPCGQQKGSEHRGLESRSRHAEEAQLHVRIPHLRSHSRQRGGAPKRSVEPRQLLGAVVEVAREHTVEPPATEGRRTRRKSGERGFDALNGALHVVNGVEDCLSRRSRHSALHPNSSGQSARPGSRRVATWPLAAQSPLVHLGPRDRERRGVRGTWSSSLGGSPTRGTWPRAARRAAFRHAREHASPKRIRGQQRHPTAGRSAHCPPRFPPGRRPPSVSLPRFRDTPRCMDERDTLTGEKPMKPAGRAVRSRGSSRPRWWN